MLAASVKARSAYRTTGSYKFANRGSHLDALLDPLTRSEMRSQRILRSLRDEIVCGGGSLRIRQVFRTPREIFRLVVGQGLGLTLTGVLVGVAASLALTRFLSSLLFGVSPMDLPTYAGITVLLVLVALLASWLPARQATRVQPMVALRYE